tara:strand:+ start:1429 stop:1998 length:570 start_codon:yes stop_codon:yes gene_type:complete
MNLIEDPLHKGLYTETEPWNWKEPQEEMLEDLVKRMGKLMLEKNGIGLAANQIHKPYRIFVMRWMEEKQIKAFINPMIVNTSDEVVLMEEGCLSYPGFWTKVKRPAEVRIRFANHLGEVDTIQLSGLAARVAQHEIDHLDGVRWYKRASPIHNDRAKNKKKKMDRIRKKNAEKTEMPNTEISLDEISLA